MTRSRPVSIARLLAAWGARLSILSALTGTVLYAAGPRVQEFFFHSEALGRSMPFTLIRPADEAAAKGAVLFLLHGRGRDHRTLVESAAARSAVLAAPFNIVLPQGEDGWYVNSPVGTGARYEDYLIEVMRAAEQEAPLSRDPRWRAIAGWSMGGYGAVRFAQRHPEEIGSVASIIGLLDFPQHRISASDGYKEVPARFGTDEDVWRDYNPILDVGALMARRVQVVVAAESWDAGMNGRFIEALRARDIAHEEVRLPGGHEFAVVEAALPGMVDFFARSFAFETRRNAARHRPRRMIYNDDTGPARASPVPLSPEQYIAEQAAPLAGTLVDTLSVDTTAGSFAVFGHRTEVGEMFLQTEGRYRHNTLPEFRKLGTDALQLWIEQGRRAGQEVFWSLRMNDTHDATNPLLFPEFKRAHPDWLMGTPENQPAYGKWSAVDFGRPEVRDYLLHCIRDVVTRYEVDGVELDFWRHPVLFRSTAQGFPAQPDEVAAMTDLLRRIRAVVDAAAAKRNRPLVLALKSPDSVAYCKVLGLDVEGWMREQLIDLWEPGGYFRLEPWIDGVALARRHGVAFYACLPENRMRDPARRAERDSILTVRARALAAWAAGVDGIATFNYEVTDRDPAFWRELGDPERLRTLPKTYFASYQGLNASRSYFPPGAFARLPTLSPNAPEALAAGTTRGYELWIGDDLSGPTSFQARLQLRVDSTDAPAPVVRWNETRLELSRQDEHTWVAPVSGEQVVPGRHSVTVSTRADLTLDDILLSIE